MSARIAAPGPSARSRTIDPQPGVRLRRLLARGKVEAHLGLGMPFCRGFFLRNPGGVSAVGQFDQGSRKRRARMSAASASISVANWSALVSSTSMICPMPCAPGLNLIRNPFPAGVVLCSIQRYSAFTIGRSQMVSGCIMHPLIRQAVSVLPQTLRSSRLDPTFPRAGQSRRRPSRG
jgi:hypothetical protein